MLRSTVLAQLPYVEVHQNRTQCQVVNALIALAQMPYVKVHQSSTQCQMVNEHCVTGLSTLCRGSPDPNLKTSGVDLNESSFLPEYGSFV